MKMLMSSVAETITAERQATKGGDTTRLDPLVFVKRGERADFVRSLDA